MERPPLWATALMVAGLVANAVLIPLALTRHRDAASTTVTPQAVTEVAEPRRVLAVGDAYTAGSDFGGYAERGWPALVADELDVMVDVAAAAGSGYVARGETDRTFTDFISDASGDYDAVVIFGSGNDVAAPALVGAAAADAYAAAAEAWPEAGLLVVGPPWVDDQPPASLLAARDAITAEAEAAGATLVDPLDKRWFADRELGELISLHGIYPTNKGHRFIARKLRPALAKVLGADSPATP